MLATFYFRPVRALPLFALLLLTPRAQGQSGLVINEVLASNHGSYSDNDGRTPDWVELYNTSTRAIDLDGWRVAINGRQHMIEGSLIVPARGHRLLWCDAHPDRGADHLGFTLDRSGGALLLIEPNGHVIHDLFTYSSLPADVSMGRLPDGSTGWSFMVDPSPGAMNRTADMQAIRSRCPMPKADVIGTSHLDPFDLTLSGGSNSTIRYTLDGSTPTATYGAGFSGPIHITKSTVVRARSFGEAQLPSEELCVNYLFGTTTTDPITLTLDPADLWGDSLGIYTPGIASNFTRKGDAWERPTIIQLADTMTMHVGVRISGSGSRSAQKRSFKIYARDRYGSPDSGFLFADGTRSSEGMLRADAGAHAFLRNVLIEELVRRHGLEVDVQPSMAMPLYLNAAYWGLYRWMPSKDAQWLAQRCGAEALDVLEGPSALALDGKNKHFLRAQQLLLRGAPIDSIDAMIDTRSLIDLACIDLWTGRADHDLNVRCYRPRVPGGQWRWLLYDMDLWSLLEENAVERMASALALETPYVRQLLAHPILQQRLLARITTLQATALDPAHAVHVVDSIFRAHEVELLADHKRWELALETPSPTASLAEVERFIQARPENLFAHLASRTHRKLRTITIHIPPADQGVLLLEGVPLGPGRHEVRCFSGVPMKLEARAADGYEFANWNGVDGEGPVITTDISRTHQVRVGFRPIAP